MEMTCHHHNSRPSNTARETKQKYNMENTEMARTCDGE